MQNLQSENQREADAFPKTTVELIKTLGTWRDVADAARTTIRLEPGTKEPSSKWKRQILLAQHSPIRKLKFNWKWHNLKYWVSVHLVRHKTNIEHWVSTQRNDRTGVPRDKLPQSAAVEHECESNAEEIMFISRRRLCAQAHAETRAAWKMVVDEIRKVNPELASCCVPECVYRGFCPEFKCCGFVDTDAFKEARAKYIDPSRC